MYGRGRGSYLGLLLESQIGKNAVPVKDRTADNVAKEEKSSRLNTRENKPVTIITTYSSDNEKRSLQSTWTSLDLLGNRERRNRSGSDSSPKPTQENPQLSGDDQTSNVKDNLAPLPDQKPKTEPVTKVQLISPEEFLHSRLSNSRIKDDSPPEISEPDTSSENSESHSSSASRYIPPHLRKGFSGKPDICPDPAVTKYKKLEAPMTSSLSGTTEFHISVPQTMAESELNWHKWKLQRSFKKLLNNLSAENVMGLSVEIRKICEASQLSTKFPGTSEVNALADLLVARVVEQKDNFEVVIQMCQLLNVMYKDEFPANLKDVLRQYRQEMFRGVVNKNSGCENFCIFLGKLCDVAKDETKSFQDCLRQSVIGCLHDWISSFQAADECSQEAEIKVSYLCFLLDVTKNVLTTEKGTWIKSCFGKIKNCILNEKVTRSVKESLLDQVIKCSLQSPTAKDSEIFKASAESIKNVSETRLSDNSYKHVEKMLSDLNLSHLMEKFQENLIRDTLLCAEKNELKNTLQEAGFAPGAILEIQLYLEKNGDKSQVDVSENLQETKPGHDVDCQTRVKNLENNLKEVLSNIEFKKQTEKQNETEIKEHTEILNDSKTQNEDEKPKESKAEIELDLKQLQDKADKLMNCQNSLEPRCFSQSIVRPPPGFSYPGEETRRLLSSKEETKNIEISIANHLSQTTTREVFLAGEKKSNIMEFKDENTQAGNPVVNWTQNSDKRNYNERSFPKHKGRGRGRRDNTGTLENSKDSSEFIGLSGDTHGPRWNSRDANRFLHIPVRENTSGYVGWSRNDSSGYSRPQHGCKDVKSNYDRPSGYSKDNFNTDATEPRAEFESSSSADVGVRAEFGSPVIVGCFICGGKDHRSAYCKNNAAMFD